MTSTRWFFFFFSSALPKNRHNAISISLHFWKGRTSEGLNYVCMFSCYLAFLHAYRKSVKKETCTAPHSLKKTLPRTLYSVPRHSQLIWKGTVNVFRYKGKSILSLPQKQCQTRTVWILGFATVLAVTFVVSNWFALMLMPFCSEPMIHCQGECYYHLSLPLMVQGNNFMYSVLRSLFSLNMICVFCS